MAMGLGNTFRSKYHQRGVAAIEMAIATPLLALLMLASAELGRAFFQYNTLTKAVRDGARYVSENALNPAGVINLDDATLPTQNLVVYGNTQGTGDTLLPALETSQISVTQSGNNVIVTANYAYQPIVGVTLPSFGYGSDHDLSFQLQASTSMRALH